MINSKLYVPFLSRSVDAEFDSQKEIYDYLHDKIIRIHQVFDKINSGRVPANYFAPKGHALSTVADCMIDIVVNRSFCYESKARLGVAIESYRKKLRALIKNELPVNLFYLYHGGYRASLLKGGRMMFEADQTELMLLYQIALFMQRVCDIYPPGINFTIVINNGVAHWVNNISLESTVSYSETLTNLIDRLGGGKNIKLLVQSNMKDFEAGFTAEPNVLKLSISEKDHCLVERFMGRSCSPEEAIYRHGLYEIAEAQWGKSLKSHVESHRGLLFRQVGSPDMLSFRPFPGGAIRVQNGTLGFEINNKKLTPKLFTEKTFRENAVEYASFAFPVIESL
jgi:hypothetical protein